MYMSVGLLLVHAGGEQGDPARIAAQVVTGIGFLGAGCIIQAGGRVTGLTSAATIWVVAAIGLVSGAGFPLLAVLAAMLVVATLAVLGALEKRYLESASPDEYRT
jgi:putative Mg2+ transporter-C (MgtC) family protein